MCNKFLHALIFFALSFFSLSGLRAQVAYNFATTPDHITIAGAPVPLTMDCLSANGIGQWTSSSTSIGGAEPPVSILLENKLASSGISPDENGVLSSLPFAYSTGDAYPTGDAVKSVSILNGSTRYVWFGTENRNRFYAEGFDNSSGTISFSGDAPLTLLTPSLGSHNPYPLTSGHQLITSGSGLGHELNALDRFDVAIDASFLYVVWEEYNSGAYSIWAEVIKLSDGSTVTGWPAQVSPTLSPGQRPTVSVDIRNSGSVGNFDIAYLDATSVGMHGCHVNWTEWNGTSFTSPQDINQSFGSTTWDAPLHARILTASEAGVAPSITSQRAVYVIAYTDAFSSTTPQYIHLFLDYIKSAAPVNPSEYCDGNLNNARPTGCPVESVVGGMPFLLQVKDNPIWAFANPYEGANSALPATADFTGFHCLYQLVRTGGTNIPTSNNPLMIIPGNSAVSGFCVNGNGTSTFFDDPVASNLNFDGYCGAVNQMGVHVHWITNGTTPTHFYRRDLRKFDQNIEENTLMTGECEVADVSPGPTLLSNLTLTLFSDPLDPFPLDSTAGNLVFDNGATLNIGSTTPTVNTGGDFVNVGFGNTVNLLGSTDNWTFAFAAGNSMDYYGTTIFNGNGQFTLTGSGASLTSTKFGNYVRDGFITSPVKWNIYGTTLLLEPQAFTNTINITATDARFAFLTAEDEFVSETGHLATFGNGSFTTCQFIGNALPANFDYCMLVSGFGTWNGTTGTGDGNYDAADYSMADNHTVTFTSCYSTTGIAISGFDAPGGGPASPPSVIINKGLFQNVGITAGLTSSVLTGSFTVSPWWPISITDATFDAMNGQGTIAELGNIPGSVLGDPGLGSIARNYSILINQNDFMTYASNTGLSGFTTFASGILVAHAPDISLDDDLREDITVTDNVFEGGLSGTETAGEIDAAIHFMDATGDIGYNTIETVGPPQLGASKYQRGIWNESSNATEHDATWTFICSNIIFGLTNTGAAGLSTDFYTGYAKLDTITGCAIGQASANSDAGHIDFSGYAYNVGPAYSGSSNSATDMAGVHHPPLYSYLDDPAYNIFQHNSSGGTQISLSGTTGATVYLGKAGPGEPWGGVYGDNDIEGTTDVASASSVSLTDVSNNYWGGGSFVGSNTTPTSAAGLGSQVISRGFECSSGLLTKGKGQVPLSIQTVDTAMTRCDSLLSNGYGYQLEGLMEESYDTLRLFMEQCPFYVGGAYNAGVVSWQVFTYVNAAVSGWSIGGVGRWPDYLTWLKKVLYLNPDTMWYCDDALAMMTAVQSDAGAQEAIARYIAQSGKCPGFTSDFQTEANAAEVGNHMTWKDSVAHHWVYIDSPYNPVRLQWENDSINADTLAHPFDTTVPTLFQDSLQILLGPQYASSVGASSPITSEALLSAQLLENPMQDEIDVSYQMGRTALVTMELRDVLGRSVPIANAKYQLEQPGDHNTTIPAPNLPPGIYYLRITTDVGDAITLKIVKE